MMALVASASRACTFGAWFSIAVVHTSIYQNEPFEVWAKFAFFAAFYAYCANNLNKIAGKK